ncbi:MAG: adenosylmethionine--8-amino-7-oxononanoate transaminase [Bacteroidota bacterium]
MTLKEKDTQYIWHPYTQMQLNPNVIPIVKGEGAHLFDEDGNRYIDAVSSWWVSIHGHANKYIADRVYQQLLQLEQVIFAGFTHPSAVELAERLLKHLPENQKKVFFSDNGSTAVEVAMKMAFQYFHNQGIERKKIIAFKDAYHGDTFGAMSASGRSIFTAPFTPFLFDVVHIDVPTKDKEGDVVKEFVKLIEKEDVAAFIFEPLILGAGGMMMYEKSVLDKMLMYAKAAGVITIADEVMTGFGRTGRMFASDHLEVKPDIMCLSKGLTGGTLPMGLTTCANFIYDAFLSDEKSKALFHGHSFTGSPVGCAAALASLDLVEKLEFYENIKRIESALHVFAASLFGNKKIFDIRHKGIVLAIDIKTSESTGYLNSSQQEIVNFFLQRKIILRPLGNVLYLMPPTVISDEDLNLVFDAIREFLK